MVDDTAMPDKAPQPQSTPPEKRRGIGTWNYFFKYAAWSVAFWAAQCAYQYLIFTPRSVSLAVIRGSAFSGATLISAALFSSAIFKWMPRYARYWRLRRNLGVSGFLFSVIHVYTVYLYLLGGRLDFIFYTWNPLENPLLFGALAYVILLAMALTSTDWAMKKLGGRRWKNLHRLVYVAYPALIFHWSLTNPAALNNLSGYLLIAMTAAAVFGQLFWFFKIVSRKKFRSLGTVIGFGIIIATIIVAILAYLRLKR